MAEENDVAGKKKKKIASLLIERKSVPVMSFRLLLGQNLAAVIILILLDLLLLCMYNYEITFSGSI